MAGGNPTIYEYVFDPNIQIDPFGLDCKANKAQGKLAEDKIYNDLLNNPNVTVKEGKILSILNMDGKGNYIAEEYHYDENDHIISIDRQHKDRSLFKNKDYFPNNIYASRFVLEYSHNNLSQIKWNANAEKEMKIIYPV